MSTTIVRICFDWKLIDCPVGELGSPKFNTQKETIDSVIIVCTRARAHDWTRSFIYNARAFVRTRLTFLFLFSYNLQLDINTQTVFFIVKKCTYLIHQLVSTSVRMCHCDLLSDKEEKIVDTQNVFSWYRDFSNNFDIFNFFDFFREEDRNQFQISTDLYWIWNQKNVKLWNKLANQILNGNPLGTNSFQETVF